MGRRGKRQVEEGRHGCVKSADEVAWNEAAIPGAMSVYGRCREL